MDTKPKPAPKGGLRIAPVPRNVGKNGVIKTEAFHYLVTEGSARLALE